MRVPSSSCSSTVRSGSRLGMMRRGDAPGTRAYREKSVTPPPRLERKKSSSSASRPLTEAAGVVSRRTARTAALKMVGLRRSRAVEGSVFCSFWVAADSMA